MLELEAGASASRAVYQMQSLVTMIRQEIKA